MCSFFLQLEVTGEAQRDPKKVRVVGDSLDGGNVGEPMVFEVAAPDEAGPGPLEVCRSHVTPDNGILQTTITQHFIFGQLGLCFRTLISLGQDCAAIPGAPLDGRGGPRTTTFSCFPEGH